VLLIITSVVGAIFGTLFILSAVPKLQNPRRFIFTVLEYRMLPLRLGRIYARVLPFTEMCIGVMLITGVGVRFAALIASLLLSSFILAVLVNLRRGRDLTCECFGQSRSRKIGYSTVLQDALLLALALYLLRTGQGWVSPGHVTASALIGALRAPVGLPLGLCMTGSILAGLVLSNNDRTVNPSRWHRRSQGETL